ncbi:MAG: hypothetical protein RID53_24410 [Coleofasciculus sp. B1-GNL1-01]|uniref:hypothetical protein n=1 Tax=Coleofasciculus sp. B1-GNL1-01 TaxID=3068484 RepID=UPI0032F8F245
MKVRLLTKLPIETGASRYRLILAPNIDAATRPYSPYNPYIPYSRDNRQTIEHLTCARFYGSIYITTLPVPLQ